MLHQKIPSNQFPNDGGLGWAFRGRCGGLPGLGELIAVGHGGALDHAKVAQSAQVPRQPALREHAEVRAKIGPPDTRDVDPWILQRVQQRGIARFEEVDYLHLSLSGLTRLAEPSDGADAGGEVVQRGQLCQIASVTADQYLSQVDQVVDSRLDGRQFAGHWTVPVFHLALVLEKESVSCCGLDARHDAGFGLRLDRGLADAVLTARPRDAGGELRANLPSAADHRHPGRDHNTFVAGENADDSVRITLRHKLAHFPRTR